METPKEPNTAQDPEPSATNPDSQEHRSRRRRLVMLATLGALVLAIGGVWYWLHARPSEQPAKPPPAAAPHSNITATIFWIGEGADQSNDYIHNRSSVWTEDWIGAYGGIDDPEQRNGYSPAGFTPRENPFYVALPYNDLDEDCRPKASQANIPWHESQSRPGESQVKNHWVAITRQDKTAYAQWEDAGPFGEDDSGYVFDPTGQTSPQEHRAGIDLSPATADYLGISLEQGSGTVAWQFIDEPDVPDGPWQQVMTRSPSTACQTSVAPPPAAPSIAGG